jgi:demethylmenaquinone methyltransferase/2-methoxy-6-polyprenyl-1,4-benzoquinol methylase
MCEYYAARAPICDEVYLRPERQADLDELRRRIPAWFAGRSVLEVACGTGYWTQFIAPVTARMTATDAVAEPLAYARRRPAVERVTFALADAFALPAILGSFNAAFAGLWLSHVPRERVRGFLAGLHARLEPGARVVLIDSTEARCDRLPIVERDAHGNPCRSRTLPDGTVHRALKNFLSEAEPRSIVDGIGANAQCWRGDHLRAFCHDAMA